MNFTRSGKAKSLFGRYFTTKRTRQIAANLAIYAVNYISIDHFLCLIIISNHSILIKVKNSIFFSKIHKKIQYLPYENFDSILLITKKNLGKSEAVLLEITFLY